MNMELEVVGYCDPRNVQKMKSLDVCGFMVHDEPSMAISAPVILLADAQRLLSQLREELAKRDAELVQARKGFPAMVEYVEEIAQLRQQLAALESQQAASVGGERVKVIGWGYQHVDKGWMFCGEYPHGVSSLLTVYKVMTVDQHERIVAALSPAGGGVDQVLAQCPDCPADQNPGENYASGWNECKRYIAGLARLNAKPQANSQEGSK